MTGFPIYYIGWDLKSQNDQVYDEDEIPCKISNLKCEIPCKISNLKCEITYNEWMSLFKSGSINISLGIRIINLFQLHFHQRN